MSSVAGVIFPVPERLVERFFDGKPRVFIKFLPHRSTKLVPGHVVVFYASGVSKRLVGEGMIEQLEFLTTEKVLGKYRDLLFLDETELNSYAKRSPIRSEPRVAPRDSKEMLTLVLGRLRKYNEPIEYHERITTAGKYLTTQDYRSIAKNTNVRKKHI